MDTVINTLFAGICLAVLALIIFWLTIFLSHRDKPAPKEPIKTPPKVKESKPEQEKEWENPLIL